jgi:arsenate reductase-like glutaredoxin family protein
MTWRNLPTARKTPGSDPEWLLLIKEYPALVRRPVVVQGHDVSLGFTDKLFARLFAGKD